jgi:hypothetical protein
MKINTLRFIAAGFLLGLTASASILPEKAHAATYVVNTAEDTGSGLACTASRCTLRSAIERANASAGPDLINFQIPGAGPYTIALSRPLPTILDDGTTIAGDSQPGYVLDLDYPSGLRSRGRPLIILDGSSSGGMGLSVNSNGNTIRGLSWINFSGDHASSALDVLGDNNVIEGNFFGLSPDGSVHGNRAGLSLRGENNYASDNVLSGNNYGIYVWSGRQEILGNLIGTDPTGERAASENSGSGVFIDVYARDTLIGGEGEGDRNIISGYAPYGYGISGGGLDGTRIINNFIGTNAAGDAEIRNWVGIDLAGGRCDGFPSGECPGIVPSAVQGNLISGNGTGIRADADRTVIRANKIGTNAAGTAALGSQSVGIYSDYGRHLLIGGYGRNEGNLISGNGVGILLENEAGNAGIFGNRIGTSLSGDVAVPNDIGVELLSSVNDLGDSEAASGNLISGNDIGVWVEGESNRVRNNRIGTNESGYAGVPNRIGINVVGDIATLSIDCGNLIAFNRRHGIVLEDAVNVLIYRNTIHSNGGDGILLMRIDDPGPLRNRFRENSIYNNAGLGIRFDSPDLNGGVEAPVLTRADVNFVEGTACPGCLVEIFVSDRDPSGFGEGKEFLAAVEAGPDGRFRAEFERVIFESCDTLTATALDVWSSSMFSATIPIGICVTPTPFTVWVIIILTAAGGGVLLAVVSIIRRWRRPFGPSPIVPGLLGGILGAGFAVGLLSLPVVRIQWPSSGQTPSCGQFLNANLLQPANGEVFESGTDVLFELSPQPDPPGMQTRWFLEVTGPSQVTVSKELTSGSINLSVLGFDPQQAGIYFWSLRGERAPVGSGQWTPLCQDNIQRMFRIAASRQEPNIASPTFTPTVAAMATPTQSPSPSTPTATLRQAANCRRGPGTEYDTVTSLPQGLTAPITGRNPERTWWQVQVPGTQTRCWLAGENVDTSGDMSLVPIVAPEAIGCWVKQPQGPDKCVAPCPPNAQPGGACTP